MKTTELTERQRCSIGEAIVSLQGSLSWMDFDGVDDWTISLDGVADLERSLLTEEVDRNHYTRILIRVMSDDLGDFITLPDWNVRFASALQCCVALVKLRSPQKWEEILNLK